MRPGRLRWRLRGAWQWPAFAVLALADAALLYRLPVAGDGPGPVAALLLSLLLNLVVVAIGAPVVGRLLRRRRRDLPRVVADDYAGTGLLLGLSLVLVGLGLAHRPALRNERASMQAQMGAVRRYVLGQAPAAVRRNLARADTWRLDSDLYRTCVPGGDPARALCLFVDTSQRPPGVARDPNPLPNARYFGPHGFP
ncbi:MAG: hypothetical protein E6G56_11925 [Actinobacteria bacterium]|nr:MAG: hypothetical protein E6G56_11925 [Actinomycetota bacterium]